jgi:flavodoxin
MKILIIYDSMYGNTEKVAKEMAKVISKSNEVKILKVSEFKPENLKSVDWLIIGTPTQGGQASQKIQEFIKNIKNGSLKNIDVSVFDTGIPKEGQKWFLRTVIQIIGYASPKIAGSLQSKGAKMIGEPETFWVNDREGPLLNGELKRAGDWIKKILKDRL